VADIAALADPVEAATGQGTAFGHAARVALAAPEAASSKRAGAPTNARTAK
jgi:hypothetical protein